MNTLQLVPAEAVRARDVLDAIEQSFGRPRGTVWYEWKHRDGPWGPSKGLVAVDDQGVVGVRLMLPWRVRFGEEEVTALRAVEAATVPRAQGRGVFTALNRALMQSIVPDPTGTFLFSTPNQMSRGGYQKLGWTLVQSVAHGYHVPLRKSAMTAGLSLEDAVADLPLVSLHQRRPLISTAWTPAALRWRTDPRTGNDYRASRLHHASGPHGLLYRILTRRRIRILSVIYAWGSGAELRALVAGTAGREGARLVLFPVGRGAAYLSGPGLIRRGGSLLAVWSSADPGAGSRWPIKDAGAWSLTMADLESVL